MTTRSVARTDVLLLSTAVIWGLAFVAQRAGMNYIGPFLYNSIRFALGALTLVPVSLLRRRQREKGVNSARSIVWDQKTGIQVTRIDSWFSGSRGAVIVGVNLFIASSLQQVGIVTTSAGKAGFITGLYVVLVPLFGSFVGKSTGTGRWIGAGLAAIGLYLLSVTAGFHISGGDILLVLCALFYTFHVLLVDRVSPTVDAVRFSIIQSAVTAVLSLLVAVLFEPFRPVAILKAGIPIAYGGVLSVGVAYSLQIVAQRTAQPAHAAILMSLEGAFAALGGYLILGETLSTRAFVGCGLMFCGMVLSQLSSARKVEETSHSCRSG